MTKSIRTIRRVRDRPADFDRYYQGLLTTYSSYSALQRGLRKAVGDSCIEARL